LMQDHRGVGSKLRLSHHQRTTTTNSHPPSEPSVTPPPLNPLPSTPSLTPHLCRPPSGTRTGRPRSPSPRWCAPACPGGTWRAWGVRGRRVQGCRVAGFICRSTSTGLPAQVYNTKGVRVHVQVY